MADEEKMRPFRMKVRVEATVDVESESARAATDWLEDQLINLACIHSGDGDDEVTFDLQDYSIGRAVLVKKES